MEEKKTFEQKLKRLESIAAELENSSITLDLSIKLYKEGIALADELRKDLESAQAQIVSFDEL
jgi:exodeoxyribonuclease VII small subunit